MTQSEANIIIAAARVALELERGGYDPFETRMAVVELAAAVKAAQSPHTGPVAICATCGVASPLDANSDSD